MDTTLPQIINTPEFLGAVMSKIANVSPELLTADEFPKVAQHIFHGMSDYLQKEAGFTEENVMAFTIGLALTNPDFNEGFSKQAGLLDGIKQYGSAVVDKISHPSDTINSALNTGKAMLNGAAAGYQHPDIVNGLAGIADKIQPFVGGIKDFWNKNHNSIVNAGVGALIGAGGNLLMGGNSPISAGLVGAAGGYLAGPSIREAYKNFTQPSTPNKLPTTGVDPLAAQKLKQQQEQVANTQQITQEQQNRVNNAAPINK